IIKYQGEEISISFRLKTKNPLKILLNGFSSEAGYYKENETVYFKSEKSSYVGGSPQIQFRPNGSEELDFEIKEVKIEFGSKATPYHPNPEDIYGANDPNEYVDILPRDKDNNVINNKVLPVNYREEDVNLLKTSD